MTPEERRNKIEAYGQAHTVLMEALQRFPLEMWSFRPTPEEWTIHEIVVHLADSEANSYVRCRKCIVEPGKSVMAYDEVHWAQALHYADQSADEALQLFKWLRLKSYRLIQSLPEPVWAQTMEHPENGTMTLDDWLTVYERHIPEHLEQMERNYTAWLKQK